MVKPRRYSQQAQWGRALAGLMASSPYKTQTALARKSGVGQSTIGRILRGEVDPQIGTMTDLVGALGMPLKRLAAVAEDGKPVELEEVDHVRFQALACLEVHKCLEKDLGTLQRKVNDAIERLESFVRSRSQENVRRCP